MGEEMFVHEGVVRLRMVAGDADILVLYECRQTMNSAGNLQGRYTWALGRGETLPC
jgi:hypothetical protein